MAALPRAIVCQAYSVADQLRWILGFDGDNKPVSAVFTNGKTDSIIQAVADDAIADTKWHHLVFQHESATPSIKIFVDGKLAKTTTIGVPVDMYETGYQPTIGDIGDTGWGHTGQLADTMFFEEVLSEEEIFALFNSDVYRFRRNLTGEKL